MDLGFVLIPAVTAFGLIGLLSSLRILWEYERGVVFRLGKLTRAKGPGLVFMVPYGIERMRKMDLRIIALDIAPQDTITKDNVSCTVNAVVYFRVVDPSKAVVEVEDYYFATSQIAQTTLRSVVGQSELDELLAQRERINEIVRRIIDLETDPWGIEVTAVEIKDIDLPKEMKRAMAKQAEAERETAGQGDRRRRRVPGFPEAVRGRCEGDLPASGCSAAAVPADRGRGGGREQLHDALPDPGGPFRALRGEGDGGAGGRDSPRSSARTMRRRWPRPPSRALGGGFRATLLRRSSRATRSRLLEGRQEARARTRDRG